MFKPTYPIDSWGCSKRFTGMLHPSKGHLLRIDGRGHDHVGPLFGRSYATEWQETHPAERCTLDALDALDTAASKLRSGVWRV